MILIVLAGLSVVSVPLLGGRLSRIIELHLRCLWIPIVALALQVLITTIAPDGHRTLHNAIHVATYALLILFLWANRRIPGILIIATGTAMNALAIMLNGGVMPAAATAQRLAGLKPGAGFHNSTHLAHPLLIWLGDIIPWPGPLPNVLSVGDCLIYGGTIALLYRTCTKTSTASALAPLAADHSATATPSDRPAVPVLQLDGLRVRRRSAWPGVGARRGMRASRRPQPSG